jgi:hypothetical protein
MYEENEGVTVVIKKLWPGHELLANYEVHVRHVAGKKSTEVYEALRVAVEKEEACREKLRVIEGMSLLLMISSAHDVQLILRS